MYLLLSPSLLNVLALVTILIKCTCSCHHPYYVLALVTILIFLVTILIKRACEEVMKIW